jgi:serine/threonine-protein kinase
LTLTALSLPAHAQSAEVGKADALFNAGRSLLEAGEYIEACPKFAEAQALAPGLGVTLYLADCYERIGRTASAIVEFRRAEQSALLRHDKRGAVAHDRAVALEAHVPQLAIVVTEAARAQGITVTCDGELVPASRWDAPVAIDPGDHEIVVSAPSKLARHTRVTLAPMRGTVATNVEPLDDRPSPLPRSALSIGDVDLPGFAEGWPTQKTLGLIAGGVGILGAGVGSVLGILASSKLSQSNDGPCDATDHCSSQGIDLRKDADHLANASTAVFVGAGVALAGGVVLYWTAPKTGRATEAVEVVPLFSSQVAGLCVRSTF